MDKQPLGCTLRCATQEDIQTLVQLRLDFLREDVGMLTPQEQRELTGTLEDYFSQYLGHGCIATLAQVQGRAVSIALMVFTHRPAHPRFPTGTTAQLLNVYTLPEYRRRGLATRVLRELVEQARCAGVSYIELLASADGRPLYEMLGFTETRLPYTPMRLALPRE
ncbi:MAG: GNAT family N-acetyltransferase [Acetanaerobacterium sp.]